MISWHRQIRGLHFYMIDNKQVRSHLELKRGNENYLTAKIGLINHDYVNWQYFTLHSKPFTGQSFNICTRGLLRQICTWERNYLLGPQISGNPAVPRISFATRFAHIFATGNEFQKYFSARRNSFDLTQNSVKAVLTVSNLIMMRTYVFR